MGYEPAAARRLRRIAACTTDVMLRDTLETLLPDMPNHSPADSAPAPRADWAADAWSSDALGEPAPRAVQGDLPLDDERLGGDLPGLARGLSGADTAELLLVLAQQATALRLVWEAHARGAIELPESLMRRVDQARQRVPRFLGAAAR